VAGKTKFVYTARMADGKEARGTVEAQSKDDAIAKLRAQRMEPVKLDPEKLAGLGGSSLFGGAARRASQADLCIFTRQLATMIGAGIPLLEAFEILADQTKDTNKGFGLGLQECADLVRGGTELSEALGKYPKIFPDIYVNMIKAGEASGQLDVILNRVADFMERSETLKREIKSAMTYPVISLILIFGITGYLMVGVVPKFKTMFDSLNAKLPALTEIVVGCSDWMVANYYVLGGGIVAVIVGYIFLMKIPQARVVRDLVMLKLPVFGPLGQKVTLSRFARTLGTLLASGVPLLQSLEIVAKTSGNLVIEDVLLQTRDTVKRGESITSYLQTSWVFPPMVVKMIGIGERSGALEQLLYKISDFYDEQVHAMVKSLTSLIEPIMLSIMGAVVGTVVAAIFLPILELQKQLQ
jgi:type IV pilus assembly protein PilC